MLSTPVLRKVNVKGTLFSVFTWSLILFLFFSVSAVLAQEGEPPVEPVLDPFLLLLQEVGDFLAGAVGFGTLITLIINSVLKKFGWVSEGQAAFAKTVLNTIFIVLLSGAKLIWPDLDLLWLDGFIKSILDNFIVIVPAALVLIGLFQKLLHGELRGVPFIGYSHSYERQKKLKNFEQAMKDPYLTGASPGPPDPPGAKG